MGLLIYMSLDMHLECSHLCRNDVHANATYRHGDCRGPATPICCTQSRARKPGCEQSGGRKLGVKTQEEQGGERGSVVYPKTQGT